MLLQELRARRANDVDRDEAVDRPERWDLHRGDEIAPGLYTVKRLGGGSDYEVHRAWSEDLHAWVAAKLLRPHLLESERVRRHMQREVELLESLAHPSLPRLFGAELEAERPYLLLEHLDGPTISSTVKRYGPLVPEQLLPIAFDVCSVLAYLHDREIVHLDLKPSNMVLTAVPKVIDLSIARTFEAAAGLQEDIGTRQYMAPEQCAPTRLGPVGPAADIWGLGATLFHAVAGRRPFLRTVDAEGEDAYPQLWEDPLPLPKGTLGPLAQLIDDCMAFEPNARPTACEVQHRLEPVLEHLGKPRLRAGRPSFSRG